MRHRSFSRRHILPPLRRARVPLGNLLLSSLSGRNWKCLAPRQSRAIPNYPQGGPFIGTRPDTYRTERTCRSVEQFRDWSFSQRCLALHFVKKRRPLKPNCPLRCPAEPALSPRQFLPSRRMPWAGAHRSPKLKVTSSGLLGGQRLADRQFVRSDSVATDKCRIIVGLVSKSCRDNVDVVPT